MEKMSFEEFMLQMKGGESRTTPGMTVSYVLIEDDDGEEEFYAEWKFINEDHDFNVLETVYKEYLKKVGEING